MFSVSISQRLLVIKASRQRLGRLSRGESAAAAERRLSAAERRANDLGCLKEFRNIRYVATNLDAELEDCGLAIIYVDYAGSNEPGNRKFLWTCRIEEAAEASPILFQLSNQTTVSLKSGGARSVETDDLNAVAAIFLDTLEAKL